MLDEGNCYSDNNVSNETWVVCKELGEGLFPNETIVEIDDYSSNKVTLFVDKRLIRKSGCGLTFLRTILLEECSDCVVVVLPQIPMFSDYCSSILRVSRSKCAVITPENEIVFG